MSDLFSILQPGYEHTRRQKELEKVFVLDARTAGRGPQPLDLESGAVTIELPPDAEAAPSPADPVAG